MHLLRSTKRTTKTKHFVLQQGFQQDDAKSIGKPVASLALLGLPGPVFVAGKGVYKPQRFKVAGDVHPGSHLLSWPACTTKLG